LVNQSLRFLQAQAGGLLNSLDDSHLVGANFSQNNVELGLLLGSGSGGSSAGNHNGSSSRHAELLFDGLDQLVQLQNGEGLYFFNNSSDLLRSHGSYLQYV